MPTWGYQQDVLIPKLGRLWSAAHGLNEALADNNTLTNNGAVQTVTLGDGRRAWQFNGDQTQNLLLGGAAVNLTGFYSVCVMFRFIWEGFAAGQSDCRIGSFGNICYLNVVNGGGGLARLRATIINGYTATIDEVAPGTITVGMEVCGKLVADYSTNNLYLYLNGLLVRTVAMTGSWATNSTISISPTFGNSGATNKGTFKLIEACYIPITTGNTTTGFATTAPITAGQIAHIAAGTHFLDLGLPTHTATSPNVSCRIIGGKHGQEYVATHWRANGPNSDTPVAVGTGTRTGPGVITTTNSTEPTKRTFFRISVTGEDTVLTTHYGGGNPQKGGFRREGPSNQATPTVSAFNLLTGLGRGIVAGDSRTPGQGDFDVGYLVMRGGGPSIDAVGVPGAAADDFLASSSAKAGTHNGVAFNENVNAKLKAIIAANNIQWIAFAPFDVNSGNQVTDPVWVNAWTELIADFRALGLRVLILPESGHENNNTTMQYAVDREAWFRSQQTSEVIYMGTGWQQWFASHHNYCTTDGTHLWLAGSPYPPLNPTGVTTNIGGQSAARTLANFIMLGVQEAYTPAVVLSTTAGTETIQPGQTIDISLSVRPTNGYLGSVGLAVTGLPTGVTAQFIPASPLTIASGATVGVTLRLTAALNAPLIGSPVSINVTATAGAISSAVNFTLQVIDTIPPQVTSVSVSGTAVTIQMNSLCTGSMGFSIFQGGGLMPFAGALSTLDGQAFTGTLVSAFNPGTVATWSYSQVTGDIEDAGGNELETASNQPATNNTPSSGGGGDGNMTVAGETREVTATNDDFELLAQDGDDFEVQVRGDSTIAPGSAYLYFKATAPGVTDKGQKVPANEALARTYTLSGVNLYGRAAEPGSAVTFVLNGTLAALP